MRLDLARSARAMTLVTLALTAASAAGCTAATADGPDPVDQTSDSITDVNHSKVKRQSIGNCWTYATATWVESMALSATHEELNTSESYTTFWHWYNQIGSRTTEIQTGGSWSDATSLMLQYGVMSERDFIASEANAEMSARQSVALDAINESLKSGALSTSTARRDRTLVRAELARAWRLAPTVTEQLDAVFTPAVTRDLTAASTPTTGTSIKRPREIPAAYTAAPGAPMVTHTLEDAIRSWRTVPYRARTKATRRAFAKRWQKALNDNQPVIISWFVDFNALDTSGRFAAPPATPGHQGYHMVVMEDYEIDGVPGFGTLAAGTLETRPEALAASLSDKAAVDFIRIKNSWGSYRSDRQFVLPGYHDLYMKYLDGPVQECATNADESTNVDDCWSTTPLQDATLPPGY